MAMRETVLFLVVLGVILGLFWFSLHSLLPHTGNEAYPVDSGYHHPGSSGRFDPR